MRRGKGDCGKDEFFFLEFFLPRAYREGRGGVRKLSKFFFLKFFFRGGVLEMREKNSWRIFTELFAQN